MLTPVGATPGRVNRSSALTKPFPSCRKLEAIRCQCADFAEALNDISSYLVETSPPRNRKEESKRLP
jgi:hypothetical protein